MISEVRGACLFWMVALLAMASPASAFPCPNGAEVSDNDMCQVIRYYGPENTSPDPRIVSRLQTQGGDRVRSLALIIGVSTYPNFPPENQLQPAANDISRLEVFLKDKQKFDEIIVLENKDASVSNISYFLNDYLLNRVSSYDRKARVLIAYSGHGVPKRGHLPPALVLANASSPNDVSNSYSLSLLRTSIENLAGASFHVLALINACYGGEVFSYTIGGGQPSDSYSLGTYALTAGADDQLVYSLGGAGAGSIFFDAVIKGIETGAADPNYPRIVVGSSVQKGGVVRLGALSDYLVAEIETLNRRTPPSPGQPFSAPWIGPIMPSPDHARGGFFFLSPVTQDGLGFAAAPPALVTTQAFAASVSSIPGRPDVKIFNAPNDYVVRGVDLSRFNAVIDWDKLASAVQFVYLKASQQGSRKDAAFSGNWQLARAAGIERGAYHMLGFCEPVEKQFEFIRSFLPSTEDMLPFAIDAEFYSVGPADEQKCAQALGKEGAQNHILQMAKLIQGYYGKVPLIYGPRQTLSTLLDDRFSGLMIWLSSFTRGSPNKAPDIRLGGKNPWALWQYTEDATVPGISGKVDANVFFGTAKQFQDFKLGKVNVAIAAVTPPP